MAGGDSRAMDETNIDGVRVIRLKKAVNDRGHLMEVQRHDDDHFIGFGQAYVTCTLPGVIKAWYRHHQQVDQIALVRGSALLVLFDDRQHSASAGRLLECRLSDDNPALVQIPPGVWHGFQARGRELLYLLHLNSIALDAANPDEDRRPPDALEIPYTWPCSFP
jgi:dTDP-4-dehydrorhamnose 3,5-epimerase